MNSNGRKLKPTEVREYRKKLLQEQGGLCILCGLKIEPGQDTLDHCFDDKTEVLTEHGFMPFPDAQARGGRVAQWRAGEITFVQPDCYIEYEYNGDMVSLTKRGMSVVCTPEHRAVVVDNDTGVAMFVPSIDIPVGDNKLARSVKIPKVGLYTGGAGVPLTDDEIRLYVAFQADGCFATGARFRLRKLVKISRLHTLLNKAGVRYTEHTTDCHQVYVGVNNVPEYFTKVFNIPLVDFTQEQLSVFIQELKFWDGSQLKGSVQYSSTEKENADYVRMAVALAGLRGTDWVRPRQAPHRDLYTLNFSEEISGDSNRTIRKKTMYYNGMVHCFSVPSGAIIIRREGKVVVYGNCHDQGHVRAVLHRNCNGIEGRIKSWVARAGKHINAVDFLKAIIKHWEKGYEGMPLHPNHLCEKGLEIKVLRKRMKRVKKERTKQKYRDRIRRLQDEIK